jgi:hypothetical protein
MKWNPLDSRLLRAGLRQVFLRGRCDRVICLFLSLRSKITIESSHGARAFAGRCSCIGVRLGGDLQSGFVAAPTARRLANAEPPE